MKEKMFNKKKYLICGATGFIGRNLIERFGMCENVKIVAVYHKKPPFDTSHLPAEVEWRQADLRDANQVDSVLSGVDYVLQAAATTSGSKDIVNRPYIHVTDNAIMNSVLLRAAFHSGVAHFVFFSCTVMYQSSENKVSEQDWDPAQRLISKYFGVGNTKIYVEQMLDFFSSISNMKTTAIRHSNIYGPHDKYDFDRSHVFGATVSKVMTAKDWIKVWGSGEEERDLLHVDDLSRFVEHVIQNQSKSFRVYNCGLGEKISVRDLVELVIKKSGKALTIKYDLSQPTIKTSVCLDTSLAEKELGWSPHVDISSGVERTIKWWQENVDPKTLLPREGS